MVRAALVVLALVLVGLAVDSFLIDPFLLMPTGIALRIIHEKRVAPKSERWLRIAWVLYVLFFYSVSVSLYFDLAWVDPLAKWCGAASGRDWMINSGVFHLYKVGDEVSPLGHAISAALFALYPMWLLIGDRIGRKLTRA